MENKKKRAWDQDNLKIALDKVISKKMSLREASKKYDIPKSTLHDKIRCLKSGEEISLQPKIGRFTKTFPPEYEEQLVNHVKDLSNRCLPLMKKEFLKLAYDLAVELKLPHRFNTEKGTAGKHFYYDFMARHSDLSLRTPESTSVMRAVGFNKPQVDLFFSNLEKLMNRYNFPPSNILYIISQKILKLSAFPQNCFAADLKSGTPSILICKLIISLWMCNSVLMTFIRFCFIPK
ncbi:PREDICTED: uncharacterized protein LOC105555900 [Vollenhovia emeryi]|uniref:uncharacterized protein LOC105555900 n=1 Tax=Vollenhovia emeryi TaxID=411798 RepID=UPI0005F3DCC1|nr:PREDICTED: uncharacterized protein LOC105555900 [Vollenhovia emeryi]